MSAYDAGVVIGALLFPLTGLTLLIVGLVQRLRSPQAPPVPPHWNPGYGAAAPGVNPAYPPQGGAPYYPQPGQWPAPGQPPYYPQPGQWPAPPRPKKRGTGLIIAGAVLLVLSLLGVVGRAGLSANSARALNVGDCVAESDFGERNAKPTSCSDPEAVMELASRGGADADCPDGKGRKDTDYTTLFWDDGTLCFAANFIEGNCYATHTTLTSGPPFTLEDCGGSGAVVEVVERIDGTTDDGRCPSGTKPVSYVEPARLYCLQPAG